MKKGVELNTRSPYRTIISFIFLVISIQTIFAQPPLPIQINPPFLSATNPTVVDILSGTLNNTSGTAQDIYLEGVIIKDGISIQAKATTATFRLEPGVLQLNSINAEALLSPISGEYYLRPDRDYIERTGAIPPGEYEICIIAIGSQSRDTLGRNCYFHSVIDLNPPILVLPLNGETVEIPFPTFIWTPPTPLPSQQATYRLRIAPLLSGQSPLAALGNNTSFHDVEGILTNLYQYPMASREFEYGAHYVWQVAVYVNDALITQSEIFTFTYHNHREIVPPFVSEKLILIVGQENNDTIIERAPENLRFYKDNGELTFSEQAFFTTPVTVYKIMDKDQEDLSGEIVFEAVENSAGYKISFVAPANRAGRSYEYLNYVSPDGEVFSYTFRKED